MAHFHLNQLVKGIVSKCSHLLSPGGKGPCGRTDTAVKPLPPRRPATTCNVRYCSRFTRKPGAARRRGLGQRACRRSVVISKLTDAWTPAFAGVLSSLDMPSCPKVPLCRRAGLAFVHMGKAEARC